MASITTRPNGHRWILFTAPNKKRYTIRLGKVTLSQAESFKHRVESLIASKLLDQVPDPATVDWLTKIDRGYYDRLATAELVARRDVRNLQELVTWHLAEIAKEKVKPSTIRNAKVVGENLILFFGADRPISSITTEDAAEFRRWLETRGGRGPKDEPKPLAKATVSRRCRRARQFFGAAVRPSRRWISINPFGEMKHWCETNVMRNVYVERDDIEYVLDEVADDYTRLLVALARYAGLRAPSEPYELKWSDIDWDAGTMNVHCVKTERFDDKEWRIVPIFPELRPYLDRIYERLAEGCSPYVFSDYRGKPWSSFARRIEGACRRRGIPMWVKPFINMRASCEYDWLQAHPINVVASWMGHSPQVALLHYNRVSKELTAREVSKSLPEAAPLSEEAKGEVPQSFGTNGSEQ